MISQSVETVPVAEIEAGDVVRLAPTGAHGYRAMKIEDCTVRLDPSVGRDLIALRGPTIDMQPGHHAYVFDGVASSKVILVEKSTLNRLVPSKHVNAFLARLTEHWGDGLTYQLGAADNVARDVLSRSKGSALEDLLPPGNMLTAGHPGALDALAALPHGRWRVIEKNSKTSSLSTATITLASPDDTTDSEAWRIVTLVRSTNARTWSCHVAPESASVVPSRAARRSGLQLSWRTAQTVTHGHKPSLQLTITNFAEYAWVNIAGDHDWADAWLIDSRGTPISSSTSHATLRSLSYLRGIEAGASLRITNVDLIASDMIELPPGEYTIAGSLPSLGLRAEDGTLVVVS